MSSSKIKLAEQVVAAHKAKLATAADKDSVRRSIAAAEARLIALKTTRVTNDKGRTFAVRVTSGPRPIAEFYDTTYADAGGFGPLGQQVSAYHVDTLLGAGTGGLLLDGAHPDVWSIDAATMDTVRTWLRETR